MATANKSTPSSLSPQNQRGTDQLQNNQEEYNDTGQLSKVGREHPQRKTLWDWLQLLIVPLLLTGLGIGFTTVQYVTSQQIAKDTQEEATLKTYLDDMTKLIFDYKLRSKIPADEDTRAQAATIARAKTLTVLHRLTNSQRKAAVVQFLYESKLIGYYDPTDTSLHDPIIGLVGADLVGADLSGATLRNANLRGVNLSDANLRNANLSCASLSGHKLCATLSDAILINATLSDADLSDAILSKATLSGANLIGATLSNATLNSANLVSADLSSADLSNAILRDANLTGALLTGANLTGAILSGAILSNAVLIGADLSGADLRDAKGLTQQQLDRVYSCKKASLSSGLTCHKQP